jgi:hypothetical protein
MGSFICWILFSRGYFLSDASDKDSTSKFLKITHNFQLSLHFSLLDFWLCCSREGPGHCANENVAWLGQHYFGGVLFVHLLQIWAGVNYSAGEKGEFCSWECVILAEMVE